MYWTNLLFVWWSNSLGRLTIYFIVLTGAPCFVVSFSSFTYMESSIGLVFYQRSYWNHSDLQARGCSLLPLKFPTPLISSLEIWVLCRRFCMVVFVCPWGRLSDIKAIIHLRYEFCFCSVEARCSYGKQRYNAESQKGSSSSYLDFNLHQLKDICTESLPWFSYSLRWEQCRNYRTAGATPSSSFVNEIL